MKLYEIDENIRDMYDMLSEGVMAFENADGEYEYIEDNLNKLHIDRKKKLENIALLIEEIEAGAEALSERAKTLSERAKTETARADRLRRYIIGSMRAFGDKRIDGELCRMTMGTRKSVSTNNDILPDEYWRTKPAVREVDKVKIAEALKAGKEISGAWFDEKSFLTIK